MKSCSERQSPEFQKFDEMVRKMISVPREEMLRRQAEYRKQVDANPNRPGPKRGSRGANKKRAIS
jgi:hypothetical protein